ncbi:unnamed protein product [Mucor hiemalis]
MEVAGQGLWSCFWSGPPPGAVYSFIVQFVAYPVYVFYFLMTLAVLISRKREPNSKRPIVVPLNKYYPYWRNLWNAWNKFIFIRAHMIIVPDISAILSMIVCTGFWYFQVVNKKFPGKSYNEFIRNQGQDALESELYGYNTVPTDEEEYKGHCRTLNVT